MNQNELDNFVAKVVNILKRDTGDTKLLILDGDLDLETYRKESGILLGLDMACRVLIDEANKFQRETLDD